MTRTVGLLASATAHWLGAAALCASIAGEAAQDFPSRTIKIVVGFGPGGLGDITSRIVAQRMSDSLGKPVVVENMPGAGGQNAAVAVARGAPDGHTLLLVSGQNAASPALFKSLPYDLAADFAMIATVGVFDLVLVVRNDSPIRTVPDLIAAAKRDPEKFNIATISFGSIQNLSALLFTSMTGLNVTIVPFRTTGEVQAALLAGQVQVSFETLPGVIDQVRSGGLLRAIAISSAERRAFLPDVPTVAESGVPDFKLVSWNGYVVAARTPPEIAHKLNQELGKVVAAPDVQKRFSDLGLLPYASSADEMLRFYRADVARWRKVATDARIEPK
jgi:tripartite-type tricarboxylate transporter receptor subunit TctC